MLHAARTSVHHRGARPPDTGKTLPELRDLAGDGDPNVALGAGPGMTATPGLAQ